MKTIKCLIVVHLTVIAFFACGYAEVLSKILRSNCIVHDPERIQNVSCWARPINRAVSMVNMRSNLTKIVNKVLINIQLHKRAQIKFKPFLINVTEDYCAFFGEHRASTYLKLLTSIYLPYTNLNHSCPYFGYVYIKDMPLDTNNVPKIWPVGEYRVDIIITTEVGKLITLQFFVEIKELPRILKA